MLGNELRGFSTQFRNIRALMLRDLAMMHGRENIGFVWIILEPMILCVGVMTIWSVMGGSSRNGVRTVELVFSGYMPLTLWRHMTGGAAVNMFRNSSSLLYHRTVTLFDLLFARLALEFIGTTTGLIVVYTSLYALDLTGAIQSPDLFILGWLMMFWISIGAAMLIATCCERFEAADKFIPPFQYLNIPVSGAFFFVDWLPPWAQKLVLWHPHASVYEVIRAGLFGNSMVWHYDLPYFSVVAFALTFAGILAVKRVRPYVRFN